MKKAVRVMLIVLAGIFLLFIAIVVVANSEAFRYDKHLPTPEPTREFVIGANYLVQGCASKSLNQLMDRPANLIEDPAAQQLAVLPDGIDARILDHQGSWCQVKGFFLPTQTPQIDFEGWLLCDCLQNRVVE